MAFITSLPLFFRRFPLPQSTSYYCPPRWTSLARSHPHGNGGVPTELDWSNYDPVKKALELADAQTKFDQSPARKTDHLSLWTLVISADIIQWDNNLFRASVEEGFSWDLRGVKVIRLAERTARREIEEKKSELFVVSIGRDEDEFIAVDVNTGESESQRMLITFETEPEVNRFAEILNADGYEATVLLVRLEKLKAEAVERGLLIGIVPMNALITPAQLISPVVS